MNILPAYLDTLPDLWEHLSKTQKPIVLYGMGDGADKIIRVLDGKRIPFAGVFASDDFVRSKTFHGHTVCHYADIKSKYPHPIILVSFATRLDNVLKNIYNLCEADEVYAPDVPVYGDTLFDKAFFLSHKQDFNDVYGNLSDDISRKAYECAVAYKITGDIRYLRLSETTVAESYHTIIRPRKNDTYVDIGAYNGDTISEYTSFAGNTHRIIAFEPDARNYKKLCATVEKGGLSDVRLIHGGAWHTTEKKWFYARSGRGSGVSTSHADEKQTEVSLYRADELLQDENVSFIKIDAEGADGNVLAGLAETLDRCQPTVLCSIYHRSEDMFTLPKMLLKHYTKCECYVRHFPYVPAWDLNFYIRKKDDA